MFLSTGNVRTIPPLISSFKVGLKKALPLRLELKTRSIHSASAENEIKTTCLHNFHKKRQAKMAPFAGYMMPIVYKEQSIKSEHLQTRAQASVFDVSHMMQIAVYGKDRTKFIEHLTVADIEGIRLNKCTLSVLTNEAGGIIDDCIIGKRHDHLHIVSNAGNAEVVWSWLNSKLDNIYEVTLERLVGKGLIALQGPCASEILQTKLKIDLSLIEFMNTTDATIKDVGPCQITRCGYTGEDGFEISIERNEAEKLMDILCQHNEIKPAGLGARDTLRLEAGLCLHGHDITDKITPVEASLSWTIHKRRRLDGGFVGSQIILNQLKEAPKVRRVGIVAAGSGPPAREGTKVRSSLGADIGTVTSGTFAPTLNKNIAMAYLSNDLSTRSQQRVVCNVRGKDYEYIITKMPFVKSNYYSLRTHID